MRSLAAVLLVALTACSKKDSGPATKAPPPAPIKAELVAATMAPTPEVLTLTGMIAADQRAEISADTAGKVLAVMVERGQRVKMGEPVVRLDVRSAALSAREAQANLATARAQKALAEEECRRAQTLLDRGAITRSEYDRQTTQCTSALQQVSAAQARAEMISKSVADGLVRAPFDGMVAEKAVTPGEWVAPGRPLFTLVDDEPLKIELSVPEKAVRSIRPDQPVVLTAVAVPCFRFGAKVTRVGAEIGRTRALIVEATLDQAPPTRLDTKACAEVSAEGASLVPGMFAEAAVVVGHEPQIAIPSTAVAQRGGKSHHVFVAVDGELQDRIVHTGPAPGPGMVSILRGIAAGERVVVTVTDDVVDGARVEAGAAAPTPTPAPAPTRAAPTPPTGSAN